MLTADELKRRVALAGAELVESGMVVGLGTGSTASYLIDELGRRVRESALEVLGVPTSEGTRERAVLAGIPLTVLDDHPQLDLTLDGADEVDAELRLIKGHGGALLREKIVATASRRFVVLVDESKLVEHLGRKFAVPIEVIPFGRRVVENELGKIGGTPKLRRESGTGQPFVTDSGHWILDCDFDGVPEPADLESKINDIPGVVENGLFVGMVDTVLVGRQNGVETLRAG